MAVSNRPLQDDAVNEHPRARLSQFGIAWSLCFRLRLNSRFWVCVLLIAFAPLSAALANSKLTYHGRIVRHDGKAVEGKVKFRIQIRSPGNENCLLFEETHEQILSGGLFSIKIGEGVPGGGSLSLDKVFQNRGTFTGLSDCNASGPLGMGSYKPETGHGRRLKVWFTDPETGVEELIPETSINFVPLAMESQSVGGFNASHLLRVEEDGEPKEVNALSTADVTEMWKLIEGTSTKYVQNSTDGGVMLPSISNSPETLQPGSIWFDPDEKAIKFYDGSSSVTLGTGTGSGTVTSITAGPGLLADGVAGGVITSSGTLELENVGQADTYVKVTTDAKGRVVSGVKKLDEADLPDVIATPGRVLGSAITSGTIGGSTEIDTFGAIKTSGAVSSVSVSTRTIDIYDSDNSNFIRFQTPATGDLTSNYTLTLPETAGANGQVLATDGSGKLFWSSSAAPGGNAGGDLDGTYPNPTLATLHAGGTGTKITYDAKGRVTSSASLDATDIPSLDWSKITTGKPTTVDGYGITDAVKNAGGVVSIQSGLDSAKPSAGTSGRLYVAWDTQKVYLDNGSSWTVVASVDAVGGGGTVTEVTVSGAPLSVTNGTTTPQISITQASGSTPGFLSAADWNTFNSKLTSDLNSGQIFVGNGSNVATARTPGGDVSMDNSGAFTVIGLRGANVSNTAPADGQVLKYVGGGTNAWVPSNFSVGDLKTSGGVQQFAQATCTSSQTLTWNSLTDQFTCTNIRITSSQVSDLGTMATEDAADYLTKAGNLSGLANPATARTNLGFTATGNSLVTATDAAAARTAISAMENVSPGTSGNVLQSDGTKWVSGPLSLSASNFGTQTKNYVLAAPTSTNGTPSFRALDASDIPNLNASKISTGTLNIARIPTGTTASTVAVGNDSRFPSSACDSGNFMRWNGTAWVCETASASDPTKVAKTGDTMTGPLELPADGLKVGTNQLVAASGVVGVGTDSPATSTALDVNGIARVQASFEGVASAVSAGLSGYTIPDLSKNFRRINLNNNTTITLPDPSGIPANTAYTLTVRVKQPGTSGTRTVSWSGGTYGGTNYTIKWETSTPPAAATGNNKETIYVFTIIGGETVWYGAQVWKEQ